MTPPWHIPANRGFAILAVILNSMMGLTPTHSAWAGTSPSQEGIRELFKNRTEPLHFSAERLDYDAQKRRFIARGRVRLRKGPVILEARQVVLDRRKNFISARGDVRIKAGQRIILAPKISFNLKDSTVILSRARLYIKQGLKPSVLAAMHNSDSLRLAGRNRISLSGRRIVYGPDGRLTISDGSFSPCDCGQAPPTWQISAPRMTVDLKRGIWLTKPVFKLGNDSVAGFPVAYIPLGRRRSGLLMPRLSQSGRDGIILRQAFFWAPSRELDFTPEIEFREERGYRPFIEFRYAAPSGRGSLNLSYLYDNKLGGVHRFAIASRHRHQIVKNLTLSADISLISDTLYLSHLSDTIQARATEYLPSTAALEWAHRGFFASLSADFYQDLQGGSGQRVELFKGLLHPVQRLPVLSFQMLPQRPFPFPLTLSFALSFTNFTRDGKPYNDVGKDGLGAGDSGYTTADPDGSEGNGKYNPGEPIYDVQRLVFRPALSMPLNLGRYLSFTPRLALIQSIYFTFASSPQRSTTALMAGADLSTTLERIYGGAAGKAAPTGAMRHTITPKISYRFIPLNYTAALGQAGAVPQLEDLERLIAAHRFSLGITTRLVRKTSSTTYRQLFAASLYQTLYLSSVDRPRNSALGDLHLTLHLASQTLQARLNTSYDPTRGRIDHLGALLTLQDNRGDALQVSYNYLRGEYREHFDLEHWEDPLFRGIALRKLGKDSFHELTISPSIKLPYIPLSLFASFFYSFSLERLLQTTFGLSYNSPCRCLRIRLSAALRYGQDAPDFSIFLDLANLGSISRW